MTTNKSQYYQKIMIERLKKGKVTHTPPFGYRVGYKDNIKTIVLDEQKAPFIKEFFRLYATGNYSLDGLINELSRKYEVVISRSTAHAVLRNKFYRGIITVKNVEYPHPYELFIDEDTFIKCNTVLNNYKRGHIQYGKRTFVFKGWIGCGVCGRNLTAQVQKGNSYYNCSSYKDEEHSTILKKYINEKDIIALVNYLLSKNNHPITIRDVIKWPVKVGLIMRAIFKYLFLKDGKLEYEVHGNYTEIDFRSYLKSEISIGEKNNNIASGNIYTGEDPLLKYCIDSRSIEEIADHLNMDILEVQTKIMDLQLEDLITENNGLWKTK